MGHRASDRASSKFREERGRANSKTALSGEQGGPSRTGQEDGAFCRPRRQDSSESGDTVGQIPQGAPRAGRGPQTPGRATPPDGGQVLLLPLCCGKGQGQGSVSRREKTSISSRKATPRGIRPPGPHA